MPRFGQPIETVSGHVLIEAENTNLRESYTLLPGQETEDRLYRSLSITSIDAELGTQDRLNLYTAVIRLFNTNPMAHRIIEVMRDYTIGDGVTVVSDNPKVQAVIDSFWDSPSNNFKARVRSIAQDVALFGEAAIVLTSNKNDPILRAQYVSPRMITNVQRWEYDLTQAEKVGFDKSVFKNALNLAVSETGIVYLPVLRYNPDNLKWEGKVAFLAVNRVGEMIRGISDIMSIADKMDVVESYLHNESTRREHMGRWFWDVTIKNATKQQLAQYAELIKKQPAPGSTRVHSDSTSWNAVNPQLGSDNPDFAKFLISYILTGAGIPSHWTSQGEPPGSGAVESVHDPVYKMLKSRQEEIKQFIESLISYQIQYAIEMRELPKNTINNKFRVVMPKIGFRDLQRSAGAFSRIASSLGDLVEKGIVSPDIANMVVTNLMIELDLLDEMPENTINKNTIKHSSDNGGVSEKVTGSSY